ncbi:hypothetical protein JK202_15020 [Gluconobacter sp. Dm-62]|uniref:3'-5' exonuclease n=1 Tax=Gluconobacter sp. Dm-62 TaxID=2799804 RepID=UPI001B8C665D|nr:exonuclease domain-containing protein [Gluconobacter sp. Dm-62]MBS1104300.1 hypothetical protein [Gluconobacter sp. Dm-62]
MKEIILDVETTGISSYDEVIEISVSDLNGDILFYSRIKPTVKISSGALRLHGVSDEMLKNEPTIRQVLRRLKSIIMDADKIYCWSSDFVIHKLFKTARAMNADPRVFTHIQKHAVDLMYVIGKGDYWPRMDDVAQKHSILWDGRRFSSINDCKVISKIIKAIDKKE